MEIADSSVEKVDGVQANSLEISLLHLMARL
jgi:hypothetical protein